MSVSISFITQISLHCILEWGYKTLFGKAQMPQHSRWYITAVIDVDRTCIIILLTVVNAESDFLLYYSNFFYELCKACIVGHMLNTETHMSTFVQLCIHCCSDLLCK